MKTEPQLLFKIEDQIAFVTLNRAEKHNALSFEILYGLVETANKIKKDRSIRAVILQGEGPSFCSGLDILGIFKNGMFVNLIKLMGKKPFSRVNLVQKVAMVWREIPVPVISLIHGNCFGGGLQIALGCDFRYASPDAKFSLLEGSLKVS
ncbi:MAG: hypothetical protein C4K58_01785 [Flavobacteriaceae bacterium]|nr:MAG: hypothetical protein C4K58_01785 [Flavobacteriaceae bacterium]